MNLLGLRLLLRVEEALGEEGSSTLLLGRGQVGPLENLSDYRREERQVRRLNLVKLLNQGLQYLVETNVRAFRPNLHLLETFKRVF